MCIRDRAVNACRRDAVAKGMKMNTKRKTLKMPVRYLMNAVLVALLFVGLSFLTQNVLSTYQNLSLIHI